MILSEAHERAVIRARERELFYGMIEREMTSAGLRHTGKPLGFALWTKAALLCLVTGVILRALPGLGLMPPLPGPPHAIPAILWASAFLAWLKVYWPALTDAGTLGTHTH